METQKCVYCNKVLPISSFDIGKNGNRFKTCNQCREHKRNVNYCRKNNLPVPPYPSLEPVPKWGTKEYWEQYPEVTVKQCGQCKKHKPLTEEYYYYLPKHQRFMAHCRTCVDRAREYMASNPEQREKKRERNKIWWDENKDKQHEKAKQRWPKYYQDNKEAIAQRKKDYWNKHRDEYREYNRNYFKTEKGRRIKRENNKKWCHDRRAKVRQSEASLTKKQWENAKKYFDNCCAYCGKEIPLTVDHFVAVVKEGEFSRDNVIPACASCNSSKREKDFFEWYPTREFYSKRREKKILAFLHYKGQEVQQKTLNF